MWSYLPIPLNDNGPRIGIMRMGLYPAGKYTIEEVMMVACALQEILLLEDDYANVNGVIFIGDFEKATMAHMFQMTPSVSKKMTVFSEEAVPLRPKASHFINTPAGFEPVFNMIKPMMSEKQQKRVSPIDYNYNSDYNISILKGDLFLNKYCLRFEYMHTKLLINLI